MKNIFGMQWQIQVHELIHELRHIQNQFDHLQ